MPEPTVKTHLPSVAQLLISLAGLVFSIGTLIGFELLLGVGSSMGTLPLDGSIQMPAVLWTGALVSLAAIPSLVLSIRRLARLPMPAKNPRHQLLLAGISFLVLLPLGYLIQRNPNLLEFTPLYVILSVLMIVVPLWWFVEFGQRGLRQGSPQRRWGLINFSVFFNMPFTILVEMIILLAVGVVALIWLWQQPELKALWMTLQTQLILDPQSMSLPTQQLGPLLERPAVWIAGFFMICLLIPMVEELLKPLALWFFIKQDWSPSEGFSAGLICGASFALVESVTSLASVPQEAWLSTLVGRIGTCLLHTLTAGLTGWALTSAWRESNYKRLGLTYLVCVLIHGCWNFFALIYGLGSDPELFGSSPFTGLVAIAPWVMGALFMLMLAILFIMNRRIRSTIGPPPLPR